MAENREFSHFSAPVAQLDRVSASEAEGCGFDPRPVQYFSTSFLNGEIFYGSRQNQATRTRVKTATPMGESPGPPQLRLAICRYGSPLARMKLSDTPGLLKDTVMAWSSDNATRLSAALAYYAVFSIAPILIIIIAIVALVFGREAAQGQIAGELSSWMGNSAANDVQSWVAATGQSKSSGIWATAIGVGVLLLGASTFFGELKNALNAIWGVTTRPGNTVSTLVRDKLLGVSMVLCIGLLLMTSLFISALITGLSGWLVTVVAVHPFVWKIVDLVISFSITTTLFALIFKILPNVHLTWRDVLPGALVTAGFFAAGKSIIAWYLGTSSVGSPFGAAGTVIILLLGVYYLTGILFFGAEFTKVYLLRSGGKIIPNRFGILTTPAAAQGVDESKAGAAAVNVVKPNKT